MIKRFQNKIAESRFALIATILLCLPAWLVSAWYMLAYGSCLIPEQSSPTHSLSPLTPHPTFNVQHSTSYVLLWGLLTLISVFLIAELNNRNALIRIYSRMVSSCFLVMATTLTITHWSAERNVVTLATSLLFYLLFLTYQDRKATGKVYYAFVSLSVASIFFPQILFFVPLLWLLMGTRLLSLSVKTFFASILGLITPYWIILAYKAWASYAVGTDTLPPIKTFFTEYVADIAQFHSPIPYYYSIFVQPSFSLCSILHIAQYALPILCAIIGTVHYFRTKQQDHIKTQLLYESIIVVNTTAIIFMLAQPQHIESLIGMIIVTTAPLIAHFVALTHTRWTNRLTKLLLFLALTITILSLIAPLIPTEICNSLLTF